MAINPDDLSDLPIYRRPIITPPMVDPSQIQAQPGTTPLSYTPQPPPLNAPPQIQPIPVNLHPSASAQAIAGMTPPSLTDPQYQPSKLRRVFSAIAGGLAGASGGAKVGMETGQALRDYKYNVAMQDYKNKLALAQEQQKAEEQTFRQATEPYRIAAPILSAESLAQRRADQTRQGDVGLGIKQEVADTGKANVAVKAKAESETERHHRIQEKYLQWKMDNPKLDDMQFLFSLTDPEDQEAFKAMYKELHPAQMLTPGEREQEKINVQSDPRNLPKETAISQAKGAGTQAAAVTPATPQQASLADQLAEKLHQNPDDYKAILNTTTDKAVKETALNKYLSTGGSLPKDLAPTARTAVLNAQTALGHIDNISKLLADPEIQKDLGPFKGRFLKAVNTIGDNILKKGPEAGVDQKIMQAYGQTKSAKEQQLLGLLAYLVTFEASSTSGTRPSWQLIHYLGSYSPRPEEELSRFLGSMQAVKSSAQNRINSAYMPTERGQPIQDKNTKTTPKGLTYKRIQE